jgi:hypothetical protein
MARCTAEHAKEGIECKKVGLIIYPKCKPNTTKRGLICSNERKKKSRIAALFL